MNNTLKNGCLFNDGNLSSEQAQEAISKSIEMYSNARPHKALGMKTLNGDTDKKKCKPIYEL